MTAHCAFKCSGESKVLNILEVGLATLKTTFIETIFRKQPSSFYGLTFFGFCVFNVNMVILNVRQIRDFSRFSFKKCTLLF